VAMEAALQFHTGGDDEFVKNHVEVPARKKKFRFVVEKCIFI
jgi:hypothetical protein